MKLQDSNWRYKGKLFTEKIAQDYINKGYIGFIYRISYTIDNVVHDYFGKKVFLHNKKIKISKKAKLLSGTRKRFIVKQTDSNWLHYFGSCQPLLNFIEKTEDTERFKREILGICKTKQDLAYWETVILIKENVLFRDNCWNNNIAGRFYKGKINEMQ